MKKLNKLIPYLLAGGLALTGCGEEDKKDDENSQGPIIPSGGVGGGSTSNADSTVSVPQVGAISLGGFGEAKTAALNLAEGDEKHECDKDSLGAFGLAIGAACHTSPFASNILLGEGGGDFDEDGDVDCADFQVAESNKGEDDEGGPGMLMHLMCQGIFVSNDNVTSFAFDDTEKAEGIAISFADFDNDNTAVGSWTRGNAASYPADIRIWSGDSLAAAKPGIAMALKNPNSGSISFGDFADLDMKLKVDFNNNEDTSNCIAEPSDANCHSQEVRIYSGDGLITDGPPNGFHLKILADKKDEPTFIALEGHYNYSAETAAAAFGGENGDSALGDSLREIYFTAVQKGNQVWGQFHFMGADGELLSWDVGGGVDILEKFASAEGVCQDLGSDEWVACTDVTAADYASLWAGKGTFESIDADPSSIDWEGKPDTSSLCTTNGCVNF